MKMKEKAYFTENYYSKVLNDELQLKFAGWRNHKLTEIIHYLRLSC